MKLKVLQPFSLVGGTALSLRYGHRQSVDLDLFSEHKLDHESIVKKLKMEFGEEYRAESKTADGAYFVIFDYHSPGHYLL